MKAKRWEQWVTEVGCYNDVTGPYTVKLLARQHPFTENAKAAQRLLTQLEAQGKEGA